MKHGIEGMSKALRERITSYLANNDSLTPEQVSDLFRDCRRALAAAPAMKRDQLRELAGNWRENADSVKDACEEPENGGPCDDCRWHANELMRCADELDAVVDGGRPIPAVVEPADSNWPEMELNEAEIAFMKRDQLDTQRQRRTRGEALIDTLLFEPCATCSTPTLCASANSCVERRATAATPEPPRSLQITGKVGDRFNVKWICADGREVVTSLYADELELLGATATPTEPPKEPR